MGGFLGIGKSAEEKELERQNQLRQEEADRARRESEIRLAEKKAKKGQEIANVKLGTKQEDADFEEAITRKSTANSSQISNSLAIGGNKNKTGVQV